MDNRRGLKVIETSWGIWKELEGDKPADGRKEWEISQRAIYQLIGSEHKTKRVDRRGGQENTWTLPNLQFEMDWNFKVTSGKTSKN